MTKFDLQSPTYTPQRFLAQVYDVLGISTDTAFTELTGYDSAMLSRLRSRKLRVPYSLMVYAALATGLQIDAIYKLAGIPLPEFTRGKQ